ncbi:MAG TPA: class A beta-lactamase [Allosphingosinicella sp.]|nr:class A beta-lactamase [Allosphingosinicella sp.]
MKVWRMLAGRRGPSRGTKTALFSILALSTALAATLSGGNEAQSAPAANPAVTRAAQPYVQPYTPQYLPATPPAVLAAQRILDSRIASIGRGFNGDVGIAVKDVETGWVSHYDGARHYPQQSVSKFWVALTALDKADRGELDFYEPVTVRNHDLTVFHQPIRAMIRGGGYNTTLNDLLHRALQQSDNTANDFLMRRAGGPDAVRDFLARSSIDGIRFGPGEKLLQAGIAGLSWRPEYSMGRAFYAARAGVPSSVRQAAFNRYAADPIDGATPLGIVDALARLKRGELLSPGSTQRLLGIMSNTKTGPQRLKGGLAPGYRLAHKTGTGQVLGATQSGYNDIGIITGPNGRSYAVAVMIRRTAAPIPQRMQMMQSVTRAVIDYDRNMEGLDWARSAGGHRAASDSSSK